MAGVKFHVSSVGQSAPSGSSAILAFGSFAIFVEYGYTNFKPSNYSDNIGGVPVKLKIDRLETHHVLAGAGLHFW